MVLVEDLNVSKVIDMKSLSTGGIVVVLVEDLNAIVTCITDIQCSFLVYC